MRKFLRMSLALVFCFAFLFLTVVTVNATEYSNFIFDKKLSLQVYDGEGRATLTVKEKNKKDKVYELATDTIDGDNGGFSEDGTIYLLFKDKTLWYLNWKIQKKAEIILLDQNVKELTRDDWGWITGWKKKDKTKKVLSKEEIKKKLSKKHITCKKSHKYYLKDSKGKKVDRFKFEDNKITYHKKTYKNVKKIKFKKGRVVAVKKNNKTVKFTKKRYKWKINN